MLKLATFPHHRHAALLALLATAILTGCGGGDNNRPGAVPGINSQTPQGSAGSSAVAAPAPAATTTAGGQGS